MRILIRIAYRSKDAERHIKQQIKYKNKRKSKRKCVLSLTENTHVFINELILTYHELATP